MMGLREELAQPHHTNTLKVVGLMQGKDPPWPEGDGSQKGTMQLRMKKGSQQHTNTPMMTDSVFRTLVSRLNVILKELSDSPTLESPPMLSWRFLALSAARSRAEIRRICQ